MDTSKERRISLEWDAAIDRSRRTSIAREGDSDRKKSLNTDAEERRKSLARGIVFGGTSELRDLLEDREGVLTQAFAAYLRQELSHENIEFWWACEDYRNRGDHGSLIAKVALACLCDEFVCEGAPKQVNLDNKVRLATLEAVQANPGPDGLLQAQNAAFTLMLKDTYPRFIKSLSSLTGSPAPASPEQHMGNRWNNNLMYGESVSALKFDAESSNSAMVYSEHEPGRRKNSLSMTGLDRYESLGILNHKRKSLSQPGLLSEEDASEMEVKRGHSFAVNLKGLLHSPGKRQDDMHTTNINPSPPHLPTSPRSPADVVPRVRLPSAGAALGAHNRGSLLSIRASMRNSVLVDAEVERISELEESLLFSKAVSLPASSSASHTNFIPSPSPLSMSTTPLSSDAVTPRVKFGGGTLTKKMMRRKTFDFSSEKGEAVPPADDPLSNSPLFPHTGSISKAKEIASYCSATLLVKRRMSRADFGGASDSGEKSTDKPTIPSSPHVQTLGKAKEWSSTLKRRISRAGFFLSSDGESGSTTPPVTQTDARGSTSSSRSGGSRNEQVEAEPAQSPTPASGPRETATLMEVPISPHLHTTSKAKEWSETLKRRISRADFMSEGHEDGNAGGAASTIPSGMQQPARGEGLLGLISLHVHSVQKSGKSAHRRVSDLERDRGEETSLAGNARGLNEAA